MYTACENTCSKTPLLCSLSIMSLSRKMVLMAMYSDYVDDCHIISTLKLKRMMLGRRRQHRIWIHELIQRRMDQGAFHHLVRELVLDPMKYHDYFRMSMADMEMVLSYVGPHLHRIHRTRTPLSPQERLAICIRFLATGESFTSLAMQFRVGLTTVAVLVPEVCEAIWRTMFPIYMIMPNLPDQWLAISQRFEQRWNFPSCIGAVDGKHIVIRNPHHSGSLYYNYKGTFSLVLMAMADADSRFIFVDVGSYGRHSDAGIFSHSKLGYALLPPNNLNLPKDNYIAGAEELGRMPYVVVGDEAFPLQRHIMRPYQGHDSNTAQDAYNYRHSRARRTVECAFGILASRWRVFHTKIAVQPDKTKLIVQACTVLHNMLQKQTDGVIATEPEHDDASSQPATVMGLKDFQCVGNRGTHTAVDIRNKFTDYFVEHPLSWQQDYINRGRLNKE